MGLIVKMSEATFDRLRNAYGADGPVGVIGLGIPVEMDPDLPDGCLEFKELGMSSEK